MQANLEFQRTRNLPTSRVAPEPTEYRESTSRRSGLGERNPGWHIVLHMATDSWRNSRNPGSFICAGV